MSQSSQDDTAPDSREQEAEQLRQLKQLRQLLDFPADQEIVRLDTEVKRLEQQFKPEDLGHLLPDAVVRVAKEDDRLARALVPTIQEAVHHAVRQDPKSLVDAIFPIMGPAIRKAIAEAFSDMVASLQQSLEHSLTVRSLKWRWEAWRTDRPFAEVVLFHTLVFRVEQVFLIHSETGLLLSHAALGAVEVGHADMVSGMLTAIQDFVKDSFGGQQEDTLQTMEVGERTVWVEPGPMSVIAAVVHGNAQSARPELRRLFKETLEQIHLEQKDALASFEGDSSPFEPCKPLLEKCLETRYRTEEAARRKRMPLVFWVVLVGLVGFVGYWSYGQWNENTQWDAYLARLEITPGIVITKITKADGQYRVAGMRDPLAADPQVLLQQSSMDPNKVRTEWELYQSVHPDLVLARVQATLAPPPEVTLRFDAGLLTGSGRAPHHWIAAAQRLAPALGGVERLDLSGLVDTDLERLDTLHQAIRSHVIYFQLDSVRALADQAVKIDSLVNDIQAFYRVARRVEVEFYIEVAGYTDGSGLPDFNKVLSRQRADEVVRQLHQRNIMFVPLLAVGKSNQERLALEQKEQDRALNRRVTLDVVYTDHPEQPF